MVLKRKLKLKQPSPGFLKHVGLPTAKKNPNPVPVLSEVSFAHLFWLDLPRDVQRLGTTIDRKVTVASCASWAHSGSCSWRWLGGELLQELLLLSRKRLRLGRPFGKLGVQKVWPVRRTILPSNDLQRGGRLRLIFLQRPALRRRPGHGVPSLVHNLTQRLLVLLELFLAPKPNVQNRLATAIPSPLDTSSSKFTVP